MTLLNRDRVLRTIQLESELPTGADQVWEALRHPGSFLYVCRGLLGIPALVGRTAPMVPGEIGTYWLWLFHVIPLSRHTIDVVVVDPATRTIRTREHGGVLRVWNHELHVEPLTERTCRYRDTVELNAGILTPVLARLGVALYRYRHRRWRKLVRKHLMPAG